MPPADSTYVSERGKMKIRTMLGAAGAAASVLALGTAGTALAASHPDATTACGAACTDVIFQNPGATGLPESATMAGNPNTYVNLDQGSDSNAREDFTPLAEGKVVPLWCTASGHAAKGSVFTNHQCALILSAGLGGSTSFEMNYNPDNGGSNVCVGDWNGQTPVPSGYRFRLTPCGNTAASIVIVSNHLPGVTTQAGTVLVISGGSNNFSRPIVATSTGSALFPQPLRWEQINVNGGVVSDTQEVKLAPAPF